MSEATGGRVGVDVGGTFTDIARFDGRHWHLAKILTTPADASRGIVGGLERVTSAAELGALRELVHGSTLVPNALIERKGVATGLLTTAGFRDILEIGREPRYDPFDLQLDKPAPLVRRALRLQVKERIGADGIVVVPLEEAGAREAARRLRDAGCQAIAVVLMHAFRNPVHEQRLAAIMAEECPDIDVSLSSVVSPEIGEYVRTSTTVANAYVQPVVRHYVRNLVETLRRRGFRGAVVMMQSNGAAVTPEVAAETPVQLIESGTAAGALAAAAHGRRCGELDLVSFDMGGTTAKICVVRDGSPTKAAEVEVARLARFKRGSGLPLRVPVVEMLEIGCGGGSIARVDRLGLLQVGPESAGADPGPACYGRGGARPTVTDADLLLGHLNPEYFLGGEMALSMPAATAAVAAEVARPLDVDPVAAAIGIADLIDSNMATALRLHVIERGGDPRRFALYAFGGAGPVHACEVARRVGIVRVICPPAAGVASAIGLLTARPAAVVSRSRHVRLDRLDGAAFAAFLEELEIEARRQVARMTSTGTVRVLKVAEMCYAGQGFHLPVAVPQSAAGTLADALGTAFEAAYLAAYGQILSGLPVEVSTWRVTAEVETPPAESGFFATLRTPGSPRRGRRRAYFARAGGFVECDVLDRYRLDPGFAVAGPAIIEERESTAVVGPGWSARVDEHSSLVLEFAAHA